jgi:hypothetical protein
MRTELVSDALTAAAAERGSLTGAIFHSDHGGQGGFKRSSQHSDEMGCADGTTARMDDDDYGASGDAFAGQAADPA